MIENKKSRTKIVSFERDADYYFLKYQRQMDRGAYLDALESLRTAVKKQPETVSISLPLQNFIRKSTILRKAITGCWMR